MFKIGCHEIFHSEAKIFSLFMNAKGKYSHGRFLYKKIDDPEETEISNSSRLLADFLFSGAE